jgi:hypothetical protein
MQEVIDKVVKERDKYSDALYKKKKWWHIF